MTPSASSSTGPLARLDAAARLILRDAELARDAVQEAMVRAWRDLPGLRDPERFDAWLHRLTVHACIDMARHRRRRVIEVELTPLDDMPVADASALVADRDFLDRALRRLDPEQRAIVVLRFYLRADAARSGGRARHPARDGQVPPPSVARGDAHRRPSRRTARRPSRVTQGRYA